MKEIIFKKKNNNERFKKFLNKYWEKLNETQFQLIKIVIINFKRYVKNEENVLFAFIYWVDFFIWIENLNKELNIKEIEKIKIFRDAFKYEINWENERLIEALYDMEDDLFLLKIIIKYTIISFDEKYINIIKNKENYFRSIWYIIPLLTIKNVAFLRFFQDIYFKKIYPEKYKAVKEIYMEKINKIPFPWDHMVTVVNNLNNIMSEASVLWRMQIRKKSYFSLFNKIERKESSEIFDSIWIRIIFKTKNDIKKFTKVFENRYIFKQKKDFIKSPKNNWYRSIHYSFLSPYRDIDVLAELQIRTEKIDKEINESVVISHYNYTKNKKKWSSIFTEIIEGEKILNKILKIKES